MRRKGKNYNDFSNAGLNKTQPVPEEFPDGAFGSPKKEKRNVKIK
ncbi:hypothetical protein [Oceanobacillus chungangensis]|nr:hypothetical protein [Oceanobacillus chungangensis]